MDERHRPHIGKYCMKHDNIGAIHLIPIHEWRRKAGGCRIAAFAFMFPCLMIILCINSIAWADTTTITKYDTKTLIWPIFCDDITGNNQSEVLLGGIDNRIYVKDCQGSDLWHFCVEGLPSSITVGDVDGDGKRDIIATTYEGGVHALDYLKARHWSYKANESILCAAVGDLTGAGQEDIVVGSVGGQVYIFNGKGELKWKKHVVPGDSIGSITIGDLFGDKRKEIILGTRSHGIYTLDDKGNIVWQIKKIRLSDNDERGLSWVQTVIVADINLDGKNELIAGCALNGMVLMVDGMGKIIWSRNFPEAVNSWSTAQLSVGNFIGDGKAEIICLLHGIVKEAGRKGTSPITMLDANGNIIFKSFPLKNFFALTAGNVDDDSYHEILLSSSTRGHFSYTVDFHGIIDSRTPESLSRLFVNDPDNIDTMIKALEQNKGLPRKSSQLGVSPSKMHVLYPFKACRETRALKKLVSLFRSLESDNIVFELMLTDLYEFWTDRTDEHYKLRVKRARIKHLTQGEIVQSAKLCEEHKIPFYALIGRHNKLYVRHETMKKILETAPNFCRGFIVNETKPQSAGFNSFINIMEKAMETLKKYGEKKLILDEFRDFWFRAPTDREIFEKLFQEKYRNILIPMYKTNRFLAPELNLGMVIGLWKSGMVQDWGFCAQDDMWKFESIFMNPPHDVTLRMEVMAATLGATYFRIEGGREFIEKKEKQLVIAEGAKRHRDLFHTLVRKGIIIPVSSSEQVVLSPLMLQIKDGGSLDFEGETEKLLKYKSPLQLVEHNYIPGYLYNLKHHYDGIFPETPYGFIGLAPETLDPIKMAGIQDYLVVEGDNISQKNGNQIEKGQEKEFVLASFRKYSEDLPFRAKGVFLSVNQISGGYQVCLMDPGHFDINSVQTILEINLGESKFQIIDAISGKILADKARSLNLNVPGGAFRILEIRQNESGPSQENKDIGLSD